MSLIGLSDRKLRDLLFELEEAQGPRFLIVVCDDGERKRIIRDTLSEEMKGRGKKIDFVPVPEFKSNLLDLLLDQSQAGSVDAISLWDLDAISSSSLDHLLTELNFHRDALSTIRVPLLLCVSTPELDRLIRLTPDFWSRRSAVYYFTRPSAAELLSKLFSQPPVGADKWLADPAISDALKTIFSAERELAKCLQDRRSFSLARADELIKRINIGVERLITECQHGRRIEVALWLWDLSHLDYDLQKWLDVLDAAEKNLYEYLYTDRNEVVLYVSEKIINILKKYSRQLEDRIRAKRRVSLMALFRKVAITKLNAMADQLEVSARLAVPEADIDLNSFSSFETNVESPRDNVFRAEAADDLENWLAGHKHQRPEFFSEEEGKLLKFLYSESLRPKAIAERLGIPEKMVNRKLQYLERKVRLYLGVTPAS